MQGWVLGWIVFIGWFVLEGALKITRFQPPATSRDVGEWLG